MAPGAPRGDLPPSGPQPNITLTPEELTQLIVAVVQKVVAEQITHVRIIRKEREESRDESHPRDPSHHEEGESP